MNVFLGEKQLKERFMRDQRMTVVKNFNFIDKV